MKGKKILIAISGSIAAYKIPFLIRLLVKAGAEVRVVMTPSSTQFVSPLVLSTLAKSEVLIDLSANGQWSNHVMVGRWADLMLVAPASANTIAKMALGICDNLLLAVYLSATCPIMLAPAMDEDMWNHQAVRNNLTVLRNFGHVVMDAPYGELASGLIGMGRMAEPEHLFSEMQSYLEDKKRLSGKKALVTAGPTYENIDPVRFIGNHSTGKMGLAIAERLANEGCAVELVMGPSHLSSNHPGIKLFSVRSAQQMYDECVKRFGEADIAVMSAAVADFTPETVSDLKIKKGNSGITLTLKKTEDILKSLGALKRKNQLLIGFALENSNERENALKKLKEKNADAIILNSLNDSGAGFLHDTNKITIFEKSGKETPYGLKSKGEVAIDIVDKIIEMLA